MSPLSLTQQHIEILSAIQPIKDGKVELFVKSILIFQKWKETILLLGMKEEKH
jgi:hypothetical protein